MLIDEPIGTYLGDGRVELNDNGIAIILEEVKGQMSKAEVLAKVNAKLKLTKSKQEVKNGRYGFRR